jgi:hypothetical protein
MKILSKASPITIATLAILIGSTMVVAAVGIVVSNYIEMPNNVIQGVTITRVNGAQAPQWSPDDVGVGETHYFGVEVLGHDDYEAVIYFNITHGGLQINDTDVTLEHETGYLTYEEMSLTNGVGDLGSTYLSSTFPILVNNDPVSTTYYFSVTYHVLGAFNIEISANLLT